MIKTWRNNAPVGIGSGVSSSYGEITYLKGIHHHDHDVTSDVLSLIDDFVSNFAFSFSMTREPSARDRGAYQIGWKHFFRHVTQSRCLSSTPLVRGKKERQLSKRFSTPHGEQAMQCPKSIIPGVERLHDFSAQWFGIFSLRESTLKNGPSSCVYYGPPAMFVCDNKSRRSQIRPKLKRIMVICLWSKVNPDPYFS